MNECVATCANFTVLSQGYCPGDKLRFINAANTSVVPSDVLFQYSDQGFTYLGRVELSTERGPRHRDRSMPTEAELPSQRGPVDRNASSEAPLPPTNTTDHGRRLKSQAARPSPTPSQARAQGPRASPSLAVAEQKVTAMPSSGQARSSPRPGGMVVKSQRVSVRMATRGGNVYTSTYLYTPSTVSAYQPFQPNVARPSPAAPRSPAPALPGKTQSTGQGSSIVNAAQLPVRPGGSPPAPKPPPSAALHTPGGPHRMLLRALQRWSGVQQQALPILDAPETTGTELHRILTVIGADSRRRCPASRWPYTAIGSLSSREADSSRFCTGTLISRQHVLTAAHCVYDELSEKFVDSLIFSPGQYKLLNGEVKQPYGTIQWDTVTVFSKYVLDPIDTGLAYDVAVIKLTKPIGLQTGWLGLKAQCTRPSPGPLNLTLAGYPSDKGPSNAGFPGGCLTTSCTVRYNCTSPVVQHDCDSFVGQSGASMFDVNSYVRAVHTLGVFVGTSDLNEGITMTQFIMDQVARWAGLLKAS